MAVLGRWVKQPAELLAYPVDYAGWLAERPGNSIASYTVAADPGISISSHIRVGSVITTLLAGGTNGTSYKITVTVTTDLSGEVKQSEFFVKIKET